MKKMLMRISAVLLAIWYCMSIIGFDVHTCTSSGRTFVATFVDGMSCADVHPEHSCCKEHCHDSSHHDADCSVHEQECCSDEYHMIQLSGCRSSVESDADSFGFEKICSSVSLKSVSVSYAKSFTEDWQFLDYDTGGILPCDLRVAYGVWRI